MLVAITHTSNALELSERLDVLQETGEYTTSLRQVEVLSARDEYILSTKLSATKVPVAHATDSYASLCLIHLPLREIIGDVETGYTGFCKDADLTIIAYGENRGDTCPYKQIRTGEGETLHPDYKELYESVMKPIEEVDTNGDPTGTTRFNSHAEFDT